LRLYLDTSALVKLYVAEEGSALVRETVQRVETVAASGIAYVEARAAFSRRRGRGISPRSIIGGSGKSSMPIGNATSSLKSQQL